MKNLENEKNVLRTQTHSLESQTLGEEIANSVTHGIGAGLSIAAQEPTHLSPLRL